MRYTIMIQYDDVDNIYIASVPELQGCMAHGKTPEDALREVSVVLEMFMEEAAEMGRQLPSPKLFAHV